MQDAGVVMKVLARIPRLPANGVSAALGAAMHRPAVHDEAQAAPAPVVESPGRRPRGGFPATSTLLLVTIAAVAWLMAGWNDSLRLARSRRPERLASQPPKAAAPTSPVSP